MLGRNPTIYASILPLTVSRSASRLSGIHQGLRRSERTGSQGSSPRREIRQKPEDEPYLTPEERRRERALARRNPIEYKVRKGKKDITEEPGPSRKSRSARFNDPRDPYGSNSVVKQLRSGKLLEKIRHKMKNDNGPMGPEEFERQMKLSEAESLLQGPSRRQHERPGKFAERAERRVPSWKSRDGPIDDFENVPRDRMQSRGKGRDERTHPASFEAKEDRPEQHDCSFRKDSGGFIRNRDEPRRAASFGSRIDRFQSSGRNERFQSAPRTEARSNRSESNSRNIYSSRANEREQSYEDKIEFVEATDENTDEARGLKKKQYEPPMVVPYTTAASQFLYGTSTVEAAIEANRRQLYKLYIYTGNNRRNRDKDDAIAKMAERRGIQVQYMDESGLPMMNKMSGSRAHNGYILETSPLPQTPVQALGEVSTDVSRPGFKISLGHQSREDALINGTPDFIMTEPSSRKPFVLLLDQILDPGNLGAVVRTASFMGVTAVVLSKRGSAPVTPTVLKASAGAAETLTIMSTESVVDFVADSKGNGWKIYAAVPPKAEASRRQVDTYDVESTDPLLEQPCVLILGNEGEGLSRQLKRAADVEVSIPNMGGSKVVDSLNVSVAAGLLCQAFLRANTQASMMRPSGLEGGETLF